MKRKDSIKGIVFSFCAGVIVSLCGGYYFILRPKEETKKVCVEMTIKRPTPFKNEQKCRAKIAECISNGRLGDAEYYIKSFHKKYDYNPRWSIDPITDLIQAYVDNGYIDKAVSLAKWSGYDVAKQPIYEYYMMIHEFNLAEEFLSEKNDTDPRFDNFMLKYKTYYMHIERVITILLNDNNVLAAKQFVNEKSVYFDDVSNEWKEYRKRYCDWAESTIAKIDGKMKPYVKETVVKRLMSKINTYESSK